MTKNTKYWASVTCSILWVILCVNISLPWITTLHINVGIILTGYILMWLAYAPGFFNMFYLTSCLLYNTKEKPEKPARTQLESYPALSILIAAYNEEDNIVHTINSVLDNQYRGDIELVIIDDGSTDATVSVATEILDPRIRVIGHTENQGKAHALNTGLVQASHELIVTIDADTTFHTNALNNIVETFKSDSDNVAAVAGTIILKNSHASFITKMQTWDYLIDISAIKRIQGMYNGTMVAQGAFSLYRKEALDENGGWPDALGEDIVLSWGFIKRGYRVTHAEHAIAKTSAPDTVSRFAKQRVRWARGMLEAFKAHGWGIIFNKRLSTIFVVGQISGALTEVALVFVFLPGIIASVFFGMPHIVSVLALIVLPQVFLLNYVAFSLNRKTLKEQEIALPHNKLGYLFYVGIYRVLLSACCLWGYVAEIFNFKKSWGTK